MPRYATVYQMLHTLAGTLTDIQQKMRMRVLGPMYRSKMEASFQASHRDPNLMHVPNLKLP